MIPAEEHTYTHTQKQTQTHTHAHRENTHTENTHGYRKTHRQKHTHTNSKKRHRRTHQKHTHKHRAYCRSDCCHERLLHELLKVNQTKHEHINMVLGLALCHEKKDGSNKAAASLFIGKANIQSWSAFEKFNLLRELGEPSWMIGRCICNIFCTSSNASATVAMPHPRASVLLAISAGRAAARSCTFRSNL